MPYIGQIRTVGGKTYIFEVGGWRAQTGQEAYGEQGLGPLASEGGDGGAAGPTYPTAPGQVVPPDPNNYWSKPGGFSGAPPVKADPNETGAWFEQAAYDEAVSRWQSLTETDDGGAGPRGPTPEQLAIERSKVATANLANYIDAAARGLALEIDAKRLTTEQAIAEFNRQLDAMTEARTGFLGAQQYTIPEGSEYVPGFEPEGLATQLGLQPWEASPVEYDPFGMALELVRNTPEIAGIGAPDTDAVQRALDLAGEFL